MPYITKDILAAASAGGSFTEEQLKAIGVLADVSRPMPWSLLLGRKVDQSQINEFIGKKRRPKRMIAKKRMDYHSAKTKTRGAPLSGRFAGMGKQEYFKSVLWDSIKTAVLVSRPFCDMCNSPSCKVGVRNWVEDVFCGHDLSNFHSLCVRHYNEKCGG